MGSFPYTGAYSYEAIQNLKWSSAEKTVARKAFDRALQRELNEVMLEAKKIAEKVQKPSDMWD